MKDFLTAWLLHVALDDSESCCRFFAESVTLYNVSQNRLTIKQDLIHLKTWGETWQMSFNVDKSVHLLMGLRL